jgi:hypothetical protein
MLGVNQRVVTQIMTELSEDPVEKRRKERINQSFFGWFFGG